MFLPIATWLTGLPRRARGSSCFAPLASLMPLGVRQRHEGGAITSAPLRWELDVCPHPHAQQVIKGSMYLRLPSPWSTPSFGRTDHSPSRTVRARFRAYGSPSLCEHPIPTWFTVSIRMTSLSVWDTRTVSLPLSVRLSTVLPRLIPWLIQITLAAQPITGKRWVLWRLRRHTGEVTAHVHQRRRSRISA